MIKGRLSVETAPTVEPVTLAEALVQCHADSGVEDSWFTDAIKSAREFVEDYYRRALIEQTLELTFDNYPSMPIELPRSPVISVDSITVYDTDDASSTVSLSNFIVDVNADPARITFTSSGTWPTSTILRSSSSVVVQYTAGYGTAASSVPSKVKLAMKLYISAMYDNRGGEMNIPEAFYSLLRPSRLFV